MRVIRQTVPQSNKKRVSAHPSSIFNAFHFGAPKIPFLMHPNFGAPQAPLFNAF